MSIFRATLFHFLPLTHRYTFPSNWRRLRTVASLLIFTSRVFEVCVSVFSLAAQQSGTSSPHSWSQLCSVVVTISSICPLHVLLQKSFGSSPAMCLVRKVLWVHVDTKGSQTSKTLGVENTEQFYFSMISDILPLCGFVVATKVAEEWHTFLSSYLWQLHAWLESVDKQTVARQRQGLQQRRQIRPSNMWVSWARYCQSSEKCTLCKGRPRLAEKQSEAGHLNLAD